MPTRTLFFARHGETPWNAQGRWQGHTDIALSDRGREQARALAEKLRGRGIGHVRASDLCRARETAEIVARALGLVDVHVDPHLRERSFGVFEGLTREECMAQYPDVWALYEADRKVMPPGSEPHEQVIERMWAAVQRAAMHPAQPDGVLVVAHGGSLRLMLGHQTGRAFAPITNGGVFRATWEEARLVDVEELT